MSSISNTNPLIIILSAPSGGGKSSIAAELLKTRSNIVLSVSATTRKPRPGEIEGIHYFFKTHTSFQNMLAQGELLEFAQMYDNFYGTPRPFVTENLKKGNDVLLTLDARGKAQVMQNRLGKMLSIFVLPPSLSILKERLIKRNQDSLEEIEKRIARAASEMERSQDYDYVVLNEVLSETVTKIVNIIDSNRL